MTKLALKLKALSHQVIVVTGATSGIGLSTARSAAAQGATLVLAARNEDALKSVCDDLTAKGARCAYKVADVGVCADVQAVADFAIAEFGGFDTWVNNAGVTIIGAVADTPLEDQRRLFDTNYWGVVHGSRVAVEHLRTREGGGAVINVGSALGDVPAPMQGIYSASKSAVKTFTRALQYELAGQGVPVSVTLIKPQAVDSPYAEHARNLTELALESPTAVYATPLVAQAILHASEHPVRELDIGGADGPLVRVIASVWPWAAQRLLAGQATHLSQDRAKRTDAPADNLHHPSRDLRERAFHEKVRQSSLVSSAQMRPKTTLTLALLAGLGLGALFRLGGRDRSEPA